MKKIYIYTLSDVHGVVKYVGKSVNPKTRLRQHIKGACGKTGSTRISKWVFSLLSKGQKPSMSIIEECSYCNWEERERFWISEFRKNGVDLCNHSDGGNTGTRDSNMPNGTSRRSEVANKLFSKHDDNAKIELWNIIKTNSLKDCIIIDKRINRQMYSQVKHGRMWNRITGLPKREIKGDINGENHPVSKITNKQAILIKQRRVSGEKLDVLSKEYGLSKAQISRLCNGKQWALISC